MLLAYQKLRFPEIGSSSDCTSDDGLNISKDKFLKKIKSFEIRDNLTKDMLLSVLSRDSAPKK